MSLPMICVFFFFNDTATTEIYTLSLHDALPISRRPPTEDRHGQALRGGPRDHYGRLDRDFRHAHVVAARRHLRARARDRPSAGRDDALVGRAEIGRAHV